MKDLESQHFKIDNGLTLETSGFRIFHSGNLTFIKLFDKTKIINFNNLLIGYHVGLRNNIMTD